MRRLKSIDEIYSEVKDYDLVITNDAALETALNARIVTPRVGGFAMTPRHIASLLAPAELGCSLLSDLELISMIRKETGKDLRYIYSEIQNFREIGKYRADVKTQLTSNTSREIYDSYEALPTLERVMTNFDPEGKEFYERQRSIAVVGVDFFDQLDKCFIPLDCDFIEIFEDDGEFDFPEIRVVGNDRQLAENAVDLVDPSNPVDYAIVLDTASPIADAVRSALYRKGLPFVNRMDVRDLSQIRDYLSVVTHAMSYDTLRVRQVKDLFATYNGYFTPGKENYLLSRVTEENTKNHVNELKELMRRIALEGMTFGQVLDELYESMDPREKGPVTKLLSDMGITDEAVTPRGVANLTYAVDNITDLRHNEQIPENEKTGVLLADCKNSVYIDKPVVIYLGMGQDWYVQVVQKKYIPDVQDVTEKNALRLCALLQQGERRVYMVNTTKSGEEARPCTSFDLLTGSNCKNFGVLCENLVMGRWALPSEPLDISRGEIIDDREFSEPFSKSTFNAFFYCPRKYMFRKLLTDGDKKYTAFGDLIHSFAEFYACYPDKVDKDNLESFADMISERYAGLSYPVMEELDRSQVVRAMENIMAYIDRKGIRLPLDEPASKRGEYDRNGFIDSFGLEKYSTYAEKDEDSAAHCIHGKFDCRWEGTVIDYKTGSAKDASEIAARMSTDYKDGDVEFQPLVYLTVADEKLGCRRFEQFYAMSNDVQSMDPGFDIMDNVRAIRIVDDLKESMRTMAPLIDILTYGNRSQALSKDFKEHLDEVLDAIASTGGDDPGSWASDDALKREVLRRIGKSDAKTNMKNASAAINKVASHFKEGMLFAGNEILITEGKLKEFGQWIDEMHAKAREMSLTTFPAEPRGKCDNCDFRKACTLAKASVGQESGGDSDE